MDFRFALPRNHWSPRRPPSGPSSLLDRAKILGARFVGCNRSWRSGRNIVPHVSGGVVQSNSQRQVAAAAAKLGLDCHLAVYHGRLASPTPDYERSGNAMLNRLFGATLHDVPWTGDRNSAIQALGERLRAEGLRPYVVPYGVSSALGAVAYATTALEIAE